MTFSVLCLLCFRTDLLGNTADTTFLGKPFFFLFFSFSLKMIKAQTAKIAA